MNYEIIKCHNKNFRANLFPFLKSYWHFYRYCEPPLCGRGNLKYPDINTALTREKVALIH